MAADARGAVLRVAHGGAQEAVGRRRNLRLGAIRIFQELDKVTRQCEFPSGREGRAPNLWSRFRESRLDIPQLDSDGRERWSRDVDVWME